MALKGTIKIPLYDKYGPPVGIKDCPQNILLNWSATQNVPEVYSTITYTLKTDGVPGSGQFEDLYDYVLEAWSIEIYYAVNAVTATKEDQVMYYRDEYHTIKKDTQFASGTIKVKHNTAGIGNVAIYARFHLSGGYPHALFVSHHNINLDTIPTVCSISCPTADIGDYPIISIVKPVYTFKNTVRYTFGKLSGIIAEMTDAHKITTWQIPEEFYNEITDSTYKEGTIYCDTYTEAGVFNGTGKATFRVNIPSSSVPSFVLTYRDIDPRTTALTQNNQKIIEYVNTLEYNVDVSTTLGATMKSCKVVCGGQTGYSASGVLYSVGGSNAFTITVEDSRGFTKVETHYLDMIPYVKPTTKLSITKVDTASRFVSLTVTGALFQGALGNTVNETTVSYRYKLEGEEWSDWENVVYNIYNDEYAGRIEIYGLDYKGTYIFQTKIQDKLITTESAEVRLKLMPVFDWSNEDFIFNVPVTVEGDLTVTGAITSNTPAATTEDPAADYIVQTSTSGIWTYRLWNSGVAECWGSVAPNTFSIATSWGALYVYDNAIPQQTYPFQFVGDPVVTMTLHNPTGNCWPYTGTPGGVSKSPAFGLARGTSGNVTVGARIYAIGRWK